MTIDTLTRLKYELECLCGEDSLATFVWIAARNQVRDMLKHSPTKINNRIFFGESDDPNDPQAIGDYSLTFAELLQRLNPENQQAKYIRARLIVFAYTLWEKVYRPTISQECGVEKIDSDAFGELRLYRHAILHLRGKLDTNTKVLTMFDKGEFIEPTGGQLREIFKKLVSGLNEIGVRYYGVDPSFKWGIRLNP